MNSKLRTITCVLMAALLAGIPVGAGAKSYSSGGGHSYSSHSSSSSHSFSSHSSGFGSSHSFSSSSGHSFSSGSSGSRSSSSGGSKSFGSSSGKSYSSGSSWSDEGRKSYTSGKSYSSGSGSAFSSWFHDDNPGGAVPRVSKPRSSSGSVDSGFSFDAAAARARQQQASKTEFDRFKQAQNQPPVPVSGGPRSVPDASSYSVKPPPIPVSVRTPRTVYVPDTDVLVTRPTRIYNVFNPYWSRPVVVYHDPYSSLFWWWLLDRSLDDRAWWAYHHRYDMDPARYQALMANDQQLEARVEALESQQAPRDPNYTPAGLDRDLMYSDHYVGRAYTNRPTTLGVVAFWLLGIPTALAVCVGFIWLVWFKRWQTAT